MKRINTLLDNNPISDNDIENVTFMGNMYASAPDYEYLYSHLDDYLKGCMDAIVDVQKVFQGGGMLDELLDDVVVNRINASVWILLLNNFHHMIFFHRRNSIFRNDSSGNQNFEDIAFPLQSTCRRRGAADIPL